MDVTQISIGISLLPILAVLLFWYLTRKNKGRKELHLFLGFMCMMATYVFLPDPSVVQKLYIEQGDTQSLGIYVGLATFFLFLSVFYFRKYLKE